MINKLTQNMKKEYVGNKVAGDIKLFSLSIHILNIEMWVHAENEDQAKNLSAEFIIKKMKRRKANFPKKADLPIQGFLLNKDLIIDSFECHDYTSTEKGILDCNLDHWFGI